ncbi:hypothetical protein KFL_006700070 [Klebsormidium nitens]|uniref:Uncharacterized protein n=1 Tax=Klebsormidium nitens TaxID=105231 RepID=A0A1Y1IMJ4_KLENI|nr:hypothetical protein KFL_006700070 [Klebsormidium nitens]|eukprot:GAQ90669.1 hypothetical protein KFL_006700070 [Klebsormidium nitens]
MEVYDYPFGKRGRQFVKLGSHEGKALIFMLNDPTQTFALLLEILLDVCPLQRRDGDVSTEVLEAEFAKLMESKDTVDQDLMKACTHLKKKSWGRAHIRLPYSIHNCVSLRLISAIIPNTAETLYLDVAVDEAPKPSCQTAVYRDEAFSENETQGRSILARLPMDSPLGKVKYYRPAITEIGDNLCDPVSISRLSVILLDDAGALYDTGGADHSLVFEFKTLGKRLRLPTDPPPPAKYEPIPPAPRAVVSFEKTAKRTKEPVAAAKYTTYAFFGLTGLACAYGAWRLFGPEGPAEDAV